MLSRFITMLILLLVVTSLVQAAEAGRIVFVAGQVHVSSRALVLGDAIQEGDEIATGADGYAYLKTVDNGFLILRPGTRARIAAYHVDQKNPANTRVKLELLSGVARSISGEAVKAARQNFRFNTPVAAIGVRGTDFTVFTDQETSRVAVISGGVIVSGFSGGCGPEGGGPCEGGFSRELFANQLNHILQIQRGQIVPQLLPSNGLSPDLSAPPRSDEPSVKAASGVDPVKLGANDLILDPKKTTGLLNITNVPLRPTVVVPVVAVVPVVVAPSSPEILWGRWEAVASLPADAPVLDKLKNGTYDPATVIGSFAISRVSNSALVLPKEGHAAFSLAGSEAYTQVAGQAPTVAQIADSRLDIDFFLRAFSTTLKVVSPGAQVDIFAQGDVTLKGELVSNIVQSNATVKGYLGGANAQEAGYVFKSIDQPALSAFGATKWSR